MAVTLLELCYRTALRLDDAMAYGVHASTLDSVTIASLVNTAPGASVSRYDGRWLYAAGQQMRVRTGGYAPASGVLTVQNGWSSPPAFGAVAYVTGLFPIQSSGGAAGEDAAYQDLVRAALAELAYPDTLELPITTADAYGLAAYQRWLDRPERLLGVREPAPVAGRRAVDAAWRGPRLERAGALVRLRLDAPFAAGTAGVLTLDVLRRADSLVDGAESATGPTADAHAVEADPEDVVTGALAFAYQVLATRAASSPDGAAWAESAAAAREAFEALASFDGTRRRARPGMAPRMASAVEAA